MSADIPLFLPLRFLDQGDAANADSLVGRWVECEVTEVVHEKRAVVVRPVAWLDSDDERRESYKRTGHFWNSQCSERRPT